MAKKNNKLHIIIIIKVYIYKKKEKHNNNNDRERYVETIYFIYNWKKKT